MNSRQKAVLQANLDEEKKVIRELKQVYQKASEDCAAKIAELASRTDMENLQSIIYQTQYQQALKGQIDGILSTLQSESFDTIAEYLTKCYENGYVGAMYDLQGQGIPIIMPIDQSQVVKALQTDSKISGSLYSRLGEDVTKLKKSIRTELSRGVANGATWNEMAEKIAKGMNSPYRTAKNNAMRIARTEGHRVQQTAQMDAGVEAKKRGADIVKQWDATLDGKTRPEHQEADGQIREIDEYFDVGGEKLMYPCDSSGSAWNVCNCRCCMLHRARWALDEDELNALKERAAYFGLDKTASFNDYKSKYLTAASESDWDNSLQPRGQVPHIDDRYSYVVDELGISQDEAKKYVDAILEFTDASEKFSLVREYQRGEKLGAGANTAEIKQISELCEEYIKNAPRWNAGETFRGVSVSDEELASYKSGKTLDMGGMSSWSSDKSTAQHYAKRSAFTDGTNSVVYHCDTQSKGTGIMHLSTFEKESEVLCSNKAQYRVTRTRKYLGITHVYLEEV